MKRVVKFFLDSSLELEELDSPPLFHSRTVMVVLTPKNGTVKKPTCGPSLVMEYHSARKNLLRGFGKGCLRSAMRCRLAKGLFVLLKGSFRECVVTWPDIRKERVDGACEIEIGVGALI
jgi:hypothetical protein